MPLLNDDQARAKRREAWLAEQKFKADQKRVQTMIVVAALIVVVMMITLVLWSMKEM
ncbi:MAG: hypothetical protein LBT37_05930 [Lactobacillaceae bacterium]|jgi:membrane protein required for beta-lactamase induction|nr:hypothetical protein [Lactobacillaceae bacterium]